MKLNKISLKWKLFFYILLFSSVVIMIFCIFQILLLDKVYRSTKIKQTKSVMNEIYDCIDGVDVLTFNNSNSNTIKRITELLENAETDLYLLKQIMDEETNDFQYPLIFSSTGLDFSLKVLSKEQLDKVYLGVEKLNEPKFVVFKDDSRPEFQQIITDQDDVITNDTIIYCQRVKLADNQSNYMVVLLARVTPVKPAIDTLKTQLLYITLIVITLSILIAIVMSRSISKPIIDITSSAKLLGNGNYNDLEFKGKGYKEISELNDTLNFAVGELKKTDELQRELIANVSHDLRTPLTLINGYAEMMKDFPGEDQQENIQIIIDEVKRLTNLVNDLLVLSKITSRTEPLVKERFNLTQFIDSIVVRQQKLLEPLKYIITFSYEEEVFIVADKGKIEQVIYNFISNAVNYSEESKNIVVKQVVSNDYVRVEIIDEGIGIKEEELSYVWQRYYRVDKGHKRARSGSGLGLSIIKEILEYHDFKYGVESVYEHGSTFWFEAPIDNK